MTSPLSTLRKIATSDFARNDRRWTRGCVGVVLE
jgi:hypothetical protein